MPYSFAAFEHLADVGRAPSPAAGAPAGLLPYATTLLSARPAGPGAPRRPGGLPHKRTSTQLAVEKLYGIGLSACGGFSSRPADCKSAAGYNPAPRREINQFESGLLESQTAAFRLHTSEELFRRPGNPDSWTLVFDCALSTGCSEFLQSVLLWASAHGPSSAS